MGQHRLIRLVRGVGFEPLFAWRRHPQTPPFFYGPLLFLKYAIDKAEKATKKGQINCKGKKCKIPIPRKKHILNKEIEGQPRDLPHRFLLVVLLSPTSSLSLHQISFQSNKMQ
jgi:hypothetical protein